MRRGEVFSLHWRDVNWNAKTITVQGDGSKTSQTRVMPMNEPLHEALDKWHQQADETTGLVFPGRRGERFDNIKKSWDALRRKCGLESIKFKDFRSDFGSRLANNGVDLAVTQRLLGHSSPVVTMRYYISIQDQTMRDAVSTVI